jgi:RNA polymerase sigma-70 factor (ECF subfamily)
MYNLDMDPVDEEQMIAWCREGNLAGYRLVYDRYSGPLLRVAMRTLGRLQDAEDAVQETFLRLFRGIGGFRSGARFSTYLFQILHNTCIDLMRKRKPWAGGLADSPNVDSLSVPASQELSHEFAQAVGRLPEQMRASFLLFAVEEFSQEETAEILAISVGAVKTQVHRARKKLRAWLASQSGGETS